MNNFGERYMTFFTPPFTGQYSLFISSDDEGELLMTDQPNITNVTRSVMYLLLATPLTILATLTMCIARVVLNS